MPPTSIRMSSHLHLCTRTRTISLLLLSAGGVILLHAHPPFRSNLNWMLVRESRRLCSTWRRDQYKKNSLFPWLKTSVMRTYTRAINTWVRNPSRFLRLKSLSYDAGAVSRYRMHITVDSAFLWPHRLTRRESPGIVIRVSVGGRKNFDRTSFRSWSFKGNVDYFVGRHVTGWIRGKIRKNLRRHRDLNPSRPDDSRASLPRDY